MRTDTTTLPQTEDPLGEILHSLHLEGVLYCRSNLTAPWGIDLPPLEDCMMFHIVTSGSCWLEVEGSPSILMQRGSLALVPHGRGHIMRNASDTEPTPLFDIPVEKMSPRYEILNHGGGGEPAQAICVVVKFDSVAAERIMKLLPPILHMDSLEQDENDWLHSTLRFISREAKALRPGGETVITRLADILVIQMIRTWLASTQESSMGWVAALRDPQIGQALAAIHRAPAQAWTVESLARQASMSRSNFSARFTEMVGESAMRYLTWWRMQLARRDLRESSVTLFVLAERLGYQSEAAFSRAFKRIFGVSPGKVRRAEASENPS